MPEEYMDIVVVFSEVVFMAVIIFFRLVEIHIHKKNPHKSQAHQLLSFHNMSTLRSRNKILPVPPKPLMLPPSHCHLRITTIPTANSI